MKISSFFLWLFGKQSKPVNADATSRILTFATLKEKEACNEQAALFRKLFGRSVRVTESLATKHAQDFDIRWAADNFLSKEASVAFYKEILPSQSAYQANIKPFRDQYNESMSHAHRIFRDAYAYSAADYKTAENNYATERMIIQLRFNKSVLAERRILNEICARAFARAYIADNT